MFRLSLLFCVLLGILGKASCYVVASDDSGKYFVAANSEHVISSSNFGTTWNATYNGGSWTGVSSDSTGKQLSLVSYCTNSVCVPPFLSSDYGATWKEASIEKTNYSGVTSDGSGKKIAAVGNGVLYSTENGGVKWDISTNHVGGAVAYSADGSTLVYSIDYFIYTQTTHGTKKTSSPEASWSSLSSDAKGTVIAGSFTKAYYSNGKLDKGVYLSTNAGASFTALQLVTTDELFYQVTVSDDASVVYYGSTKGLYQYNIAKKSTTKPTLPGLDGRPVKSIATSKTGNYVVVASDDTIWVSSDYGVTFTQTK